MLLYPEMLNKGEIYDSDKQKAFKLEYSLSADNELQ